MIFGTSKLRSLSVEQAVGRSKKGRLAPNRSGDVMLIQWLLNRILDSAYFLGSPLDVDGVYGAQTDYHLCRFLLNLEGWLSTHPSKSGMPPVVLPVEFDTII